MKIKKKGEEKKKREIHPFGLEFNRVCWDAGKHFSEHLAKYLKPAVFQLNIEGTTASKIGVVECLAHKTKALVIFL